MSTFWRKFRNGINRERDEPVKRRLEVSEAKKEEEDLYFEHFGVPQEKRNLSNLGQVEKLKKKANLI